MTCQHGNAWITPTLRDFAGAADSGIRDMGGQAQENILTNQRISNTLRSTPVRGGRLRNLSSSHKMWAMKRGAKFFGRDRIGSSKESQSAEAI